MLFAFRLTFTPSDYGSIKRLSARIAFAQRRLTARAKTLKEGATVTKEQISTELAKYLFTIDNQGIEWKDANSIEREEYQELANTAIEWLDLAGLLKTKPA